MSKETGVVPETSARVHFDIMNISSGQQGDGRSRRKNSSDKFFVRHRRALTDKKEKKGKLMTKDKKRTLKRL